MGLQILSLAIIILLLSVLSAPEASLADQSLHCQRQCGDQTVPYPFGIFGDSENCFINSSYELKCDHTHYNPPILFFRNIPIFNISVKDAIATVQVDTAYTCYNETGIEDQFSQFLNLNNSPFTLSSTLNRFMAIGCDTLALLSYDDQELGTGCFSICDNSTTIGPKNLTQVEACSDIGCCQTTQIPKGLKNLDIKIISPNNHSNLLVSNPCDYAFLTAGPNANLFKDQENTISSQIMLDWAVGDTTCEERKSICGPNTYCINSDYISGYSCSCKKGYAGNPYLTDDSDKGCQDIDECLPANRNENPCKGKCKNTPGNYICLCSFGYGGDGKLSCRLKTITKIALAAGIAILLIAFVLPLGWIYKKKIQEHNQRKNGGLLLKHLSVKIFTKAQIQKATNNFDDRKLLGEGGNGWVYKGVADNTEIAIKISKVKDQNQIGQFLNEVDIVSKINHKNVVKLLGVCLETKVPMLVYEFVSNGTLFQHIHGNDHLMRSWSRCVRIAAETARALEYMHSLAYPPIIHRDIKTANILLDVTYTAKVADFGASKLIPIGQNIGPDTSGQGTTGYMDPEYLQTGELTVKSDVYGFGVVLMEVLCKRKPILRVESGELVNIVKVFTSAVEDNQLDRVLEIGVANEDEMEQVHVVAELAVKCVALPSKYRPTMTEVTEILDGLTKEYRNLQIEEGSEELVGLLADSQEIITTSVHFELEHSNSI